MKQHNYQFINFSENAGSQEKMPLTKCRWRHFVLPAFSLAFFSTRVKMSAYVNPFIELAPVLDATPQINSCMVTTNKNTHI